MYCRITTVLVFLFTIALGAADYLAPRQASSSPTTQAASRSSNSVSVSNSGSSLPASTTVNSATAPGGVVGNSPGEGGGTGVGTNGAQGPTNGGATVATLTSPASSKAVGAGAARVTGEPRVWVAVAGFLAGMAL